MGAASSSEKLPAIAEDSSVNYTYNPGMESAAEGNSNMQEPLLADSAVGESFNLPKVYDSTKPNSTFLSKSTRGTRKASNLTAVVNLCKVRGREH